MTIHIDIAEAQTRFFELILAAERGESIVITKDARPIAQITAANATKRKPVFGSARGMIAIADDFDAPIDDFDAYMP